MDNLKIPSVIYEIFRSFITVAETLNISRAVDKLGFTRQTIRRHLDDLEDLRGVDLFEVRNRQYQLTDAGQESLHGAIDLVSDINDWVAGHYSSTKRLQRFSFKSSDQDYFYYSQQHPLFDIWAEGVPILKEGMKAWTEGNGSIEDPAFDKIKPYILIFRNHRSSWLCTHVGQTSSFATWLGQTWAQSAVGKALENDPENIREEKFTIDAYEAVHHTGAPRYDHVYGMYSRSETGEPEPVAFQRLLLPLKLPDGEFVLGSLVARTNCILIEDMNKSDFEEMQSEHLMEYEIK